MVNFSHLLLPTALLVTLNDKPPKQKKPPQERSPDYYANLGDAIRTLREDIPLLFQRELNFDIYTEDVIFRDPRNSFAGLPNYKTIFWSLRFHGRIFFSKLYVEVKRIWQPPCEDGIIKLRWTVHGIPRVPWEAEGTFDGISTYKLDQSGKIYEHAVDNVLLRDPPMLRNPLLAGLNLAPLEPQTPQLGAWFTDEPQEQQQAAQQQPGHCLASSTTQQQQQQPAAPPPHQSQQHGGHQGLHAQGHQQHQQPQQRHWMASVTFSWVRLYASLLATVQLAAVRFSSEQQHSQQQHACAGAGAASGGCGELPLGSEN